jgi:hypothetical protein
MKTLIALTVLLSISFGLSAADENAINYVTANGQTYFGEKIKMGMSHTRVLNNGTESAKIDNEDVDAFMRDGRLFERRPVVCNNREVKGEAMMEFVTSRSGLRLYKYTCINENCGASSGDFTKSEERTCYFVFKDGDFYLKIDENNAQSSLPFFGIDVRE